MYIRTTASAGRRAPANVQTASTHADSLVNISTVSADELQAIVLRVLRHHAPRYTGVIGLDTPIGAEGLGLDSVACVELVLALERETGLELREDALTEETLATPRGLVRCLTQS